MSKRQVTTSLIRLDKIKMIRITTITKRFIGLALGFLAMTFSHQAQASHMMGADISYKCNGGPGKYKIIFKIYRDCKGISFNNPTIGAYIGNNGGTQCGSIGISAKRTSISDVSLVCAGGTKPCNPQNTGNSGEGVEVHTYEATVDFNVAPWSTTLAGSGCCEVNFTAGQCCRNGAINTGPGNNNFFATAMINVCNLKKMSQKCNTSPALSNDPVAYLCCNEPYTFNNGAVDTAENDSISYDLVPGIASLPNTSVNYTNPFTYQYPMSSFCIPPTTIKCTPNTNTKPPRGFFFDKGLGDIIFTPTECKQVGIIVVQMTEYRKDTAGVWQIIGRTRRDMQLIVQDCGFNKPPRISGSVFNQVCEGDKICFTISGTDETFTPHQTIPDTVEMKWNKGIPGATFKILNPNDREKDAEFCWQTKVGQANDVSYSFTVTASDDNCPRPNIAIKGFKVKVKPRAFSTREYKNLTCGRLAFRGTVPAGFSGTPSYRWSFRDSLGKNEFYYSTLSKDTLVFKKGGKFIVTHTVNNGDNCPTIYKDTIIVPDPPIAILATKDTFACYGTDLKLEPNILFAKAPYRYYWTRPLTHKSGDTLSSLLVKSLIKDTTIMVRITDGDGCIFYDTAIIFNKALPVVNLGPDRRVCDYEQVTFDAGHADTMKYLWNNLDTTRTTTVKSAGDYSVLVTNKEWGCIKRDTAKLIVNKRVVSVAGANKTICTRDSIDITANHIPSAIPAVYQWSNITDNNVLGSNSKYRVSPRNNGGNGTPATYFLYELWTRVTEDTHMCQARDTMQIKVNTLPRVSWTKANLDPICWVQGDILLNPYIDFPKDINNITIAVDKTPGIVQKNALTNPARWMFKTQTISNTYLTTNNGHTERLTMTYTDTNGCTFSAAANQKINANPRAELIPRTYCQDLGKADMAKSVKFPTFVQSFDKVTWEVLESPAGVNPAFLIYNKPGGTSNDFEFRFGAPSEDYYSGNYKFRYCLIFGQTGCKSCLDTNISIVAEPKIAVNPPPTPCVNSDTIDMLNYFTLNGNKPLASDGVFRLKGPNGSIRPLVNGHLFFPGWGTGQYEIKYSNDGTGCLKEDSFTFRVKDTPNVILLPNKFLCETASAFNLSDVIDITNPATRKVSKGSGEVWSGQYVVSNVYTPTSQKNAAVEGPHRLKLVYTDYEQCVDTEYFEVRIRTLPEAKIDNAKPGNLCAGDAYPLNATSQFNNGVQWTTLQTGDGLFTAVNNVNTDYNHGPVDATNRIARVKITTIPLATEVCPQASDSMTIVINPYPVISIDPPIRECAPFTADFTSNETQGISPATLTYQWIFGNGDTGRVANPTGILYDKQGIYNVSLTVNNTAGNCATTITENGFVEIYPIPEAFFTTDPPLSTTIALPRFQMQNTSKLNKTVFTNGFLNYSWKFNDPAATGNDTSTLENPKYAYGKDTGYYNIELLVISDKGCMDTMTQRVYIGPDIIVFIPDVFSPNGFGPNLNNTFGPVASNFKDFSMLIFNRWGEKMYETKDIAKQWDGTYLKQDADQGVYAYYIEISSKDDKVFKFEGTFHLVR